MELKLEVLTVEQAVEVQAVPMEMAAAMGVQILAVVAEVDQTLQAVPVGQAWLFLELFQPRPRR